MKCLQGPSFHHSLRFAGATHNEGIEAVGVREFEATRSAVTVISTPRRIRGGECPEEMWPTGAQGPRAHWLSEVDVALQIRMDCEGRCCWP